jgi:hypothetical protein
MVTLLELRITSNIGQPLLNRLNLSYSFHIGVISFVFLIFGNFPMLWRFGIALSSLTQLFKRIRASIRCANGVLNALNSYLTEGDFCLSLLEFMTFVSLVLRIRNTGKAVSELLALFYFLWIVLYRYATNGVHRQLWNTLSFHVVRFAGMLPGVLGNVAMVGLAFGNAIGTGSCSFYRPRKNEDDALLM